jgi:3-oxoacyl-[acyl-carrier protein] reductase
MDKVILITGGSQGLGAQMARRFAREGASIAINCYNQDTLENGGRRTKAECEALGGKAECFIADVSSFEACEKLVKDTAAHFGTIDVLINNAGITRDNSIASMNGDQFDAVIAANLKSVFNMTRHVTRLMMKKRSGHIINMASVAGVYGNRGQANYSAAKAGVIGLTKTTAKELGSRGIICNAIAPGLIESPMTDVLSDDLKAKMLSAVSLGRFGTAEDVAEVAYFLATTAYVTGQVLIVDGGLAM